MLDLTRHILLDAGISTEQLLMFNDDHSLTVAGRSGLWATRLGNMLLFASLVWFVLPAQLGSTSYKPLGSGHADPPRILACSVTSCGLVSIVFVIALVVFWFQSGSTTSPQFDCDVGFVNWQTQWSTEKKEFCCTATSRGCSLSTAALPATTVPPARAQIVVTGSPNSQATAPQISFNCDEELANFDRAWSASKKTWCCTQQHKGCSVAGETTSPPYICDNSDVAAWSMARQIFCCQKAGVGCPKQVSGC